MRRRTRLMLAALGVMLVTPVVISLATKEAQASGYIVSWAIDGSPNCEGGGASDCPQSVL